MTPTVPPILPQSVPPLCGPPTNAGNGPSALLFTKAWWLWLNGLYSAVSALAIAAAEAVGDLLVSIRGVPVPNASQTLDDFRGDNLSLAMFGAVGNTRTLTCATTAGSATATPAAGSAFTAADVGKRVILYGAGSSGNLAPAQSGAFGAVSTAAYVVAGTIDGQAAVSVSFAANCVTAGVTWEVTGSNSPSFAGESTVYGPAALTPLAASDSYVIASPPFRYYRAKIIDTVGGTHGTCYITAMAMGYVMGATITAVAGTTATIAPVAAVTQDNCYTVCGTDDTAAIQAAITYAASRVATGTSNGGASLRAPVGNYLFSAPISQHTCVTIKGEHGGATIFYADGAAMPVNVAQWNMSGTFAIDNAIAFFTRLEDVRIDCGHVPGSVGILCDALQENSGIYRVTVVNWLKVGVQASTATDRYGCVNWIIEDPWIYPSTAAFLDDTVVGISASYALFTTMIRGTVLGQGGYICGYGKSIEVSNGELYAYGQIHFESARIGLHFNTGGGGLAWGIDTQSFVQVGVQIDGGVPVLLGWINGSGQTSIIDNTGTSGPPSLNVLTGIVPFYIASPTALPVVQGTPWQFGSQGTVYPNLITMNPVNFGGEKQGGIWSVNSMLTTYPNWTQTATGSTMAMFMRLAARAFEIRIGAATNTGGADPGTQYLYVDDGIAGTFTPRLYFDATGMGPLLFGNNIGTNWAQWWHGGSGQNTLKLQRSTNSGSTWTDVLSVDLTTGIVTLAALNIPAGGSTVISTGAGSVKMSTAIAATNTAWIPIEYAGTTYYIPAWTTNAP